ncbi:MFS transporter [Francisella opportunistica]|uniref:MFS transporter n=1 Tax=Francisella opportunistica TaxID=2016517 RepID=UPI000E0A6E64|nr:MFS transporter [Francisella opportunistica]AXH32688.1 MFS transporter [Francisella opportunistica]
MLVTKYQRLVITLIILTGICSGFDIGVISGTLPMIKSELSLNLTELSEIAGIVFFGALFSKFTSGPLMDFLSRKNVIAFGAFLFTTSMILMMFSNTYTTLMLSRLLQGISIGFLLTVIPVYISETSVAKFRGRAMAIFQLSLVSGIFLANLFASLFVTSLGWRFIFACAIPFSILLFVTSLLAPFSPSWLILKGKNEQALTISEKLALKVQHSLSEKNKIGFFEFIKIVIKQKYYLSILLISLMAVLNGFVGINVFISYGPTIFGQLGSCPKCDPTYYGLAMTLINLVATVCGLFLVDIIGRRKLIIAGLFISFLAIFTMIFCVTAGSNNLALLMLIIVVFGGAVGPGVCIWLILSEVLPVHIRGIGISVALVSKALIESMFISRFLDLTHNYGYAPVLYFMGICIFAFIIVVYKFLPEMANKELI